MYIVWQSICTLYLLTCQVRVTIGDSGLCGVQALINCPFPQLMLYPALSSVSILRLKCTSWLRSRLVSPSRPASERDIRRHYDIIVCRNKINMRIPVKNSACVCVKGMQDFHMCWETVWWIVQLHTGHYLWCMALQAVQLFPWLSLIHTGYATVRSSSD